jgi:hypothetical protein
LLVEWEMAERRPSTSDHIKQKLDAELRLLQNKTGIGFEVTMEWRPGAVEYGSSGRKLAEIVRGDIIYIFSNNLEEAINLVRHGFLEWILNQHTRPYLALINKLISLYEEMQYERKETIIEALLNLF